MLSHVQHFGDSMNCSPPDTCVHGILQARILEWVAVYFSRGSSQPRDRTHVSCTAGRYFTAEPPGKPLLTIMLKLKSKLRSKVDLLEEGFIVNGNSENWYCVWSSVGSSFTFRNMTKPVTEPQFQTSISALKYIKHPVAAAHLASGLF